MTAWRKIACFGLIGTSLFIGCTVTTTTGTGDGGTFGDTGGSVGTGGSSSTTGGTTGTGGTSETATTIVQCTANYVEPTTQQCGDDTATTSCDSCLQTKGCTEAYKACYLDTQCTTLVSNMMQCMFDAAVAGTSSEAADQTCQTSQGLKGTASGAAKASALWAEIYVSLECSLPCCAVY